MTIRTYEEEIECHKKLLKSWHWNLENTSLPEAKKKVEFHKKMVEVVLPDLISIRGSATD